MREILSRGRDLALRRYSFSFWEEEEEVEEVVVRRKGGGSSGCFATLLLIAWQGNIAGL